MSEHFLLQWSPIFAYRERSQEEQLKSDGPKQALQCGLQTTQLMLSGENSCEAQTFEHLPLSNLYPGRQAQQSELSGPVQASQSEWQARQVVPRSRGQKSTKDCRTEKIVLFSLRSA